MRPLAIVIPWFGRELKGGAEQQAFQIATRLAARGHAVEVLTTCNESFYSDWSVNHFAPGSTAEFGLTIRRFPVDSRNAAAFDSVNARLLNLDTTKLVPGVAPIPFAETQIFCDENIKSAALIQFLQAQRDSYEAFIFLPYMFQPITTGLSLVSARAWLQPCLHNEAQAYFPQTAEVFHSARGLLFNSEGEMELALRLYGPGIFLRSTVIGEGIESIHLAQGATNELLPPALKGCPFLLYLGRRDRTKNVDLMVRAFANFKSENDQSNLQLVIAGPGGESFGLSRDIHDLGLVSDQCKTALLSSARALVQPSVNESFSRTMMEAWSVNRPVAVHAECPPTATAVKQSGGGWMAATEAEWAKLFARIAGASDEELKRRGALGRRYADEHANWEKIIPRYEAELHLTERRERGSSSTSKTMAIHQLLPDIAPGDAISNQALAIRDHLRKAGYASEIFVKRCDERMNGAAKLFDESTPAPGDSLIYHHSIGSELTAFAISHSGPKCLVYHNITPAEHFVPYRPGFAWLLEAGRMSLKRIAPHFPVSVGDSAYNAAELIANGFERPGVLPIIVNPDKWNMMPDEGLMKRLQDGRRNLLFVGRLAPNKKQDRLIDAYAHYRKLDPASRLILVGEGRASDPYVYHVLNSIKRQKLEPFVEITGQVDDNALLAYYRTAHLYWSFSEHEGFGAPLIEAMWFDVPVLALNLTAVPETLNSASALFEPTSPLPELAARAFEMTHDPETRASIIEKQRRRRLAFIPSAVGPILSSLIDRLITTETVMRK